MEHLFAYTVAILAVLAVFAYKYYWGQTIIYADVSGSMSYGEPREKVVQALHRQRKFMTTLKAFDTRVVTVGPMSLDTLTKFERIGGGGSFFQPVIDDFRQSGAKRAIVITDGEMYMPKDTDLSGIRFINVLA